MTGGLVQTEGFRVQSGKSEDQVRAEMQRRQDVVREEAELLDATVLRPVGVVANPLVGLRVGDG